MTLPDPNGPIEVFRPLPDGIAPPSNPEGHQVYAKRVSGVTRIFQKDTDGIESPIGSGGGVGTPAAARIRRNVDFGMPGRTLPATTRVVVPMDTIEYATPGMVDLVAHPGRITITQDGLYDVCGVFAFDAADVAHGGGTEFVTVILQNGCDSSGHGTCPNFQDEFGTYFDGTMGTPGVAPYTGFYVADFGTTTFGGGDVFGTYIAQMKGVPAHAGDFFMMSVQSDQTFGCGLQNDIRGFHWGPMLTVARVGDIPT
jgi:hypothetical protein